MNHRIKHHFDVGESLVVEMIYQEGDRTVLIGNPDDDDSFHLVNLDDLFEALAHIKTLRGDM
jgi:hypothetical protein